jgi:hypothetical protein
MNRFKKESFFFNVHTLLRSIHIVPLSKTFLWNERDIEASAEPAFVIYIFGIASSTLTDHRINKLHHYINKKQNTQYTQQSF